VSKDLTARNHQVGYVPRILVIDDDPGNADYVARILSNFQVDVLTDPLKAQQQFKSKKYDLLVSDQKMPALSGVDLIKACNIVSEDFLGLIISAYTDSNDLIDAVNSNLIYNYIIKPFTPDILLQHVHRAYESLCLLREKSILEQKLQSENERLMVENNKLRQSDNEYGLNRLSGTSIPVLELKERISTYALSDSNILITGETGTGKELVAQAVHELSLRAPWPLIKINCTTLSSTLIESELFGYEKGSFTGADQSKKGFFEVADKGTIFLDEVGDLPLDFQPKLLRILQFGTFFPVGGREEKYSDVRIIAATNIELEGAVKKGRFREDLYHRLNRLRLRVPPLRERKEDIPELFKKIYEREYGFEKSPLLQEEALSVLMQYSFPGNVRELETYIHRLVLETGNNGRITAAMLKKVLEPADKSDPQQNEFVISGVQSLKQDIEFIERSTIEQTLKNHNYNITRTAETLGLSRQGLHNKLKKYHLYKKK
jgi:DNA-binding NtrC family response regulator